METPSFAVGQSHRNFYQFPKILEPLCRRKRIETVFRRQITASSYVESVGTGWLAGMNAERFCETRFAHSAADSAIGALAVMFPTSKRKISAGNTAFGCWPKTRSKFAKSIATTRNVRHSGEMRSMIGSLANQLRTHMATL